MPTIVVDGVAHDVADGSNLLEACLALGYPLPYFCWHPALGSVGACRQCAVKTFGEGGRARIVMACMTEATDGARLSIADPEATAFRKAVVEWLMRNHPHDCPVCDEGGECHLQDVTVMTGHAYRQHRFRKRTYRNQDLGPFVHHEMNRCIQCYRCVRFYRDHAGGADLAAQGCHDHVYFGRHADGTLESPFSGNLVEVCPTGVFTDKTFRHHYTRKWDLTTAPSVCVHCGVGCNTAPGERYGTLRRIRNRHNEDVNGWFLCDRGRYGYDFVNRPDRLRAARHEGAVVPPEEAARCLVELAPGAIGVGSPRASLESNLALRQLVGPDRFFAGVSTRELTVWRAAVRLLRSVPSASVRDLAQADAVLVLGEDVLNTAPRLALALRQAATNAPRAAARARLGVREWHDQALRDAIGAETGPFLVVTPGPTALDVYGTALRAAPEDVVRYGLTVASGGGFADALRAAERPVVVTGMSLGAAVLEAAAAAAHACDARLAIVAPECNSLGLAMMADRSIEDCEEPEGRTAIVLENDLYRRMPAAWVEAWFGRGMNHVVLDALETPTTRHADLLLPTGTFAESSGTFVSGEGRAQRFFRVFPRDEVVRDAWRWLQPGWTLDDALAALAAEVPALAGAVDAAPRSDLRRHGERVPRQTHRFSGRTAMVADRTMHEPKPPADPDSPLAFSMEGAGEPPPPSLRPFAWAPGWSSDNALNVLPRGPAGVRLLEPTQPLPPPTAQAEPVPDRPGEVLVVEAHLVLGTEPMSALAPAVAARIPDPYLEMAPEDAPADRVALHLDGATVELPVRRVPGLTPGVARLPRGLPGLSALHGARLPAPARVEPR